MLWRPKESQKKVVFIFNKLYKLYNLYVKITVSNQLRLLLIGETMKDLVLRKRLASKIAKLEREKSVMDYLECKKQLNSAESRIKNAVKSNLIVRPNSILVGKGWKTWTNETNTIEPVRNSVSIDGMIGDSKNEIHYHVRHRQGYEVKPTMVVTLRDRVA